MAQNTSKVPKDGNSVKIGADKIMQNHSISSQPCTDQILLFLHNKGIHFLDQISQWDINSQIWKGWNFPPIPNDLRESFDNLQTHLHIIAPIVKTGIDSFRWDPTGSSYTIQAGHQYCAIETILHLLGCTGKLFGSPRPSPKSNSSSGPFLKGESSPLIICKRGVQLGLLDA